MKINNNCMLFLIMIILSGCSKNDNADKNIALARVGDKVITSQEFIQRSEYTVRPSYCRNSNYIHKKIILNSLIAEKLLALEAGPENELEKNADFQAYLLGRKEQAMRQVHYYEEAYKKVEITPDVFEKEYKVAGRRYQVSYFSIPDEKISGHVSRELNSGNKKFAEMYFHLTGDTVVPRREIHWQDPENTLIHSILFKEQPEKNEIIGPLQTDGNTFLFMKVDGWIDRMVMSDNAVVDRKKTVKEKLLNEKAWAEYNSLVAGIMKNKEMQFYKETYQKLLQIAAPVYIKSDEEKKKLFNNSFWKGKKNEEIISQLPQSLDEINHLPLFSIDGKIWKVERFRSYLKQHPLVFRKEDVRIKNFAEQFKLAIVDMVRDYYITEDAYDKGYDKLDMVNHNVEMWRDNMVALFQKYDYLKKAGPLEKDQMKMVREQMTPYVDRLQDKYQHLIEINIPEFEKTQLTRVDMLVLRPDQPFPVVVPSFPLVTNDNRLDYGNIMK